LGFKQFKKNTTFLLSAGFLAGADPVDPPLGKRSRYLPRTQGAEAGR